MTRLKPKRTTADILDKMMGSDEEELSDPISVLKYSTQVHGRTIKKDIRQDFTLTHWKQSDKIYALQMFKTATLAKQLVIQMAKNTPNKEEASKVEEVSAEIFDTYMSTINMLGILNRNDPKNPLIYAIIGTSQELQQQEEEGDKEDSTMKKLTEELGKKESEKK